MKAWLIGGAACLLAGSAMAQSTGAYVGGNYGISNPKALNGCAICDKDNKSWKVYGGYKFTDHIAVEGGWARLGGVRMASSNSLTGTTAAAEAHFDGWFFGPAFYTDVFPNVQLGLRVGYARWKSKFNASVSQDPVNVVVAEDSDMSNYLGVDLGFKLSRNVVVYAAYDYTTMRLPDTASNVAATALRANLATAADYSQINAQSGRTYRFDMVSVGLRYGF